MTQPSPQKTLEALLAVEIDGQRPADMRRILKDERQLLQSAMQSGDPARIGAARDEAVRTAGLWGVQIS